MKSSSACTSVTYDHHPEQTTSQKEMKEIMTLELRKSIFYSPTFGDKAFPDRFGVFNEVYAVVRNSRHSWSNIKSWKFKNERSSYRAYVSLLQEITETFMSRSKIQKTPSDELYFRNIKFTSYDRDMGEKLNDALGPIKPDILATFRNIGNTEAHWQDVEIIGEVKSNWKQMIAQCATYARCMFAAHENRRFCIIIIAHHIQNCVRIGTLSRAGLFLTPKLYITRKEEDFMTVVRVVVGILSASPLQAGVDVSSFARYLCVEKQLYRTLDVYAKHRNAVGRATYVRLVSLVSVILSRLAPQRVILVLTNSAGAGGDTGFPADAKEWRPPFYQGRETCRSISSPSRSNFISSSPV